MTNGTQDDELVLEDAEYADLDEAVETRGDPLETEAVVFATTDDDLPKVADRPVCNGCGETDFPEGNVTEKIAGSDHTDVLLHVCTACGAMTATEMPIWGRPGPWDEEQTPQLAITSEGWLAREGDEVVGPGEQWDVLEELGYERAHVEYWFGERDDKPE